MTKVLPAEVVLSFLALSLRTPVIVSEAVVKNSDSVDELPQCCNILVLALVTYPLLVLSKKVPVELSLESDVEGPIPQLCFLTSVCQVHDDCIQEFSKSFEVLFIPFSYRLEGI